MHGVGVNPRLGRRLTFQMNAGQLIEALVVDAGALPKNIPPSRPSVFMIDCLPEYLIPKPIAIRQGVSGMGRSVAKGDQAN